jgi:hypothetical protein
MQTTPVETEYQSSSPTFPVTPKSVKRPELLFSLRGNAPHDIAQCRAEKNSQKQIGHRKDEVPERLPHPVIDMTANLQRNSTKYQRPKNKKESQIVTGKGDPKEARKGDEHDSTEGDQPYLVPRPKRPNGRYQLPALGG